MNVISTIIDYKGVRIKVEGEKIYTLAFGTTINNRSMHWSWIELRQKDLKPELLNVLKEKKLL